MWTFGFKTKSNSYSDTWTISFCHISFCSWYWIARTEDTQRVKTQSIRVAAPMPCRSWSATSHRSFISLLRRSSVALDCSIIDVAFSYFPRWNYLYQWQTLINNILTTLFGDLLPSFGRLNNSMLEEVLVFRSEEPEQFVFNNLVEIKALPLEWTWREENKWQYGGAKTVL